MLICNVPLELTVTLFVEGIVPPELILSNAPALIVVRPEYVLVLVP